MTDPRPMDLVPDNIQSKENIETHAKYQSFVTHCVGYHRQASDLQK